ncbi:18804_t:CDS:1, partial [Gigaspora rosea]
VTQHCEEQINTLQHNNAKSVKKNKHSVSLVSRHEKRNTKWKCKKCCLMKKRCYYGKNPDLCRECNQASLRILSGIKLIDDFIESTQTF